MSSDVVPDIEPYILQTVLTLTRLEGTDTAHYNLNLILTWRRQSTSQKYSWNSITIPIPELTFFPFTPRILAGLPLPNSLIIDVTPHTLDSENQQYLMTYTIANPTSSMLYLEAHLESSDACAFAGPKQFHVTLLQFSTYVFKVMILPIQGEWIRLPRLTVLDEKKKVLEILRVTEDLKNEGSDLFLRTSSSNK
jgi:Gryzun, putative trafficking through Golgi